MTFTSHNSKLALLCAFESKLIDLFWNPNCLIFENGTVRIGLERHGSSGEITLSLIAQELRDFCLLGALDDSTLSSFAAFVLDKLEHINATRARIGPINAKVSSKLQDLFGPKGSNFVFCDAILAVEPLMAKPNIHGKLPRSLQRASRNCLNSGLVISSSRYSVEEMAKLHHGRWGGNRPAHFFTAMEEFCRERYCDCISIQDGSQRIVGQQIDFCFADERHYYYSVANHGLIPGIGTMLLAESVRRFLENPDVRTYSFGRGGERYKYRYASGFRLNHYLLAFRVNGRDAIE
jgi:hypothetical protein